MLLGLTVLRLDLSRDLSTTLVVVPMLAAEAALAVVGEATLEPPDEELLLWLEMDMGDTRSLDPPDPDSDDSSPRHPRPSRLRKATFAGSEPVGEPTDSREPVGEPRLLTDIGEVGSVSFVSEIVALMGRLTALVFACTWLGVTVSGT